MIPKPSESRIPTEEPRVLDDVIQKIDESLPAIHQMCKVKQKRSPTSAMMRARFKELVEDPILNEEGTDIKEAPPTKVNGAHDGSKAG
jgi:hypothetical protein